MNPVSIHARSLRICSATWALPSLPPPPPPPPPPPLPRVRIRNSSPTSCPQELPQGLPHLSSLCRDRWEILGFLPAVPTMLGSKWSFGSSGVGVCGCVLARASVRALARNPTWVSPGSGRGFHCIPPVRLSLPHPQHSPPAVRPRPAAKSDLIVSVLRRGWPGLRGLERLLCGTRIRSGNRLGETQGPARPQGGGRGSGRWRQRSREKGSGALPPCWTGGPRGGGKLAVPAGNSVYKVTMHFINFQIINPPAMSR